MKAALAAVLLVASALPVRAQPLNTPEDVLDHLVQHRKDVALVSFTVAPEGSPDTSDPILLVNADLPMALASTIKIVVLATYAREVVAGRIDPQAELPIREWERFYLPGTDGGAHAAALAALGIATDQEGFASDPEAPVSWDRIAQAMIRSSDNAATDLLLSRIGDRAVRATLSEAGLPRHPQPLPILGLFLSWENHDQGPLTRSRLKRLTRMSPKAYAKEVWRLQNRYLDENWREAELLWRQQHGSSYQIEAQAAQALFPKGTARDYARVMARVLQGSFLSPKVSEVMRWHLGWPMEIPGNAETFLNFGDKGGALASVLTEAMYFTPKRGDFGGTPHVSVLFLRNLSSEAFGSLTQTFAHQLFLVELGLSRSFAEETEERLSK
ncbi:MAG TPA: serine hydrolase [Thermoanaerobaculia bacterium]|nr:serine hydrolase [Thermoanaerobaculia bacterium]